MEIGFDGEPVVGDFAGDGGDDGEEGAVFGKRAATRALRRICLLRFSRRLEVRRRSRCSGGRRKTVRGSGTLASSLAARGGAEL